MGGKSAGAWRTVLDDLISRGLRRPAFIIVDGAAELEKAIAAAWDGVLVHTFCRHVPHSFRGIVSGVRPCVRVAVHTNASLRRANQPSPGQRTCASLLVRSALRRRTPGTRENPPIGQFAPSACCGYRQSSRND